MKAFKFFIYTILFVLIFSCENNSEFDILSKDENINNVTSFNKSSITNLIYSDSTLVIQYKTNLSNKQKDSLKQLFDVKQVEVCDNCDEKIEKWMFLNTINIENKKLSIKSTTAGAESLFNVDYEFKFNIEDLNNAIASGVTRNFQHQIVNNNNGVTIAVLDSGVDANFPLFNSPFLYNSLPTSVSSELAGWNFVNHNNDIFDDNTLLHGTTVTYIINKMLNDQNIPHQIMPIKVCDDKGRASYFDILCGLSYALPRADIINMSLGWYRTHDSNDYANTIFTNLIIPYEDSVLIVTSAGNSGSDNDDFVHYPSSFPQNNIIGIASTDEFASDIAYFSNYGTNSVDFFANGENIPFFDNELNPVKVSGTSFSAPLVTAVAAKHIHYSGTRLFPTQIINALDIEGMPISFRNNTKYNKVIFR